MIRANLPRVACRRACALVYPRRGVATVGAFSIVEPSARSHHEILSIFLPPCAFTSIRGVSRQGISYLIPGVRLADTAEVLSHVSLRGETTVGPHTRIFTFASIGSQRFPTHKIAIGARTAIREHVSILPEGDQQQSEPTVIGEGALVMSGVEIGYGTSIGNGVVIGSNSRIESSVRLDDGATVGGLCHLKTGIRIGRGSMIGGRLTVPASVLPFCLVDASPSTGLAVTRCESATHKCVLLRDRSGLNRIRLLQSVFDALFRNITESSQLVARAQKLAGKYDHGQPEDDRAKQRAIEMISFILDNQKNNFLMR